MGHQGQSRGNRDIGQDVGRVLEPQAVLDQPELPRLGDQLLEDLLMRLGPQPLTEVRQEAGVRQWTMEAKAQEQPEGHVTAALFDDLAIGEIVLILEEFQFQKHQRLGRGVPQGRVVIGEELLSDRLEIDGRQDTAHVVVSVDRGIEYLLIQRRQRDVIRREYHGRPLPNQLAIPFSHAIRLTMTDTTPNWFFQQSPQGGRERDTCDGPIACSQ